MSKNLEKIKIAILFLIAFIGFATGINYYKIVHIDNVSMLKGCFEFGLYPFFDGNANSKIFISLILSTIKHYVVFVLGTFNWIFVIVGILNLFGLSFKLGVSVKCCFSLLGAKGIFSNILLTIFVLFIVVVSILFLYFVINSRISCYKNYRINYNDILFVKKTFLFAIVFVIIVFLFLLMLKYANSRLFGLLKTIL